MKVQTANKKAPCEHKSFHKTQHHPKHKGKASPYCAKLAECSRLSTEKRASHRKSNPANPQKINNKSEATTASAGGRSSFYYFTQPPRIFLKENKEAGLAEENISYR
jgi:hypothetical protein